MTRREAFRQLRSEFYTAIAPYCGHKDEEGLHDFCLGHIEAKVKEFAKSLTMNGLPEATYTYGTDRGVAGGDRVSVTDFGNGFYFFFEISVKGCFDKLLDEEMPDVLDD